MTMTQQITGGTVLLLVLLTAPACSRRNQDSPIIIVHPGIIGQRGPAREGTVTTLTEADAQAIASECPAVLAVSPLIGTSGQVIGGDVKWQPDQMLGVGPDYPRVCNWDMASGEFFTDRDITGATKVCVIGQTLVLNLFPDTDPIEQQVRVK